MPEGYVHACIAQTAAQQAAWNITNLPAFLAGANGPDSFFCFEAWRKPAARRFDLPALGERMHRERTGAFLRALCRHAVTGAQQDYFMGFLSHYAVDCTVHPFVEAVSRPGQLYGQPHGHGFFEAALDSTLHKQVLHSSVVPIDDISPQLTGTALADVTSQLQNAIRDVYEVEVGCEILADAFAQSHFIRGTFSSTFAPTRWMLQVLEPFVGGKGVLSCHFTPARMRGISKKDKAEGISLPKEWTDPTTGEKRTESISDLMEQGRERTLAYYNEILRPSADKSYLWRMIGGCDYLLGVPTQESMDAPQK